MVQAPLFSSITLLGEVCMCMYCMYVMCPRTCVCVCVCEREREREIYSCWGMWTDKCSCCSCTAETHRRGCLSLLYQNISCMNCSCPLSEVVWDHFSIQAHCCKPSMT